jgi:glucan phosphoethanolaminetransferase (alkaline phosphatase superfamily)
VEIRTFCHSIATESLKFVRSRRLELFTAALFALGTAIFELVIFRVYRENSLLDISRFSHSTGSHKFLYFSLAAYAALFVAFYLIIFTSIISSTFFRLIYLLLFSAVWLYEYSLQGLFQRFSTSQDASVALYTTEQQRIAAFVSYWNILALVPCLVFVVLLILSFRRPRLSFRASLLAFISLFAVVIVLNISIWTFAPRFYVMDSIVPSFGASDRSLFGYLFTKYFTYLEPREPVQTLEQSVGPQDNVVVILDESVRSDHLSINGYTRPTTPYLEELASSGKLKNYGTAVSLSTRSLETLRMFITGLTHNDVNELTDKVDRASTIFQYAKAAGYKTIYFDGQVNNFWAGRPDDLKFIDDFYNADRINPTHEPEWDNDRKIAETVRSLLTNSTGNFVFVFKFGDHTAYSNDFPADSAIWLPSSNSVDYPAMASDHALLINTYDNAVHFNLETFFRTLLPDQTLFENTTIIYTSDHGQTLSENGESFSHGGESLNEALVPMFVIGDHLDHFDSRYLASHENIFPTLLDLMRYPVESRSHNYGLSLLNATASDSSDRYFVSPDFSRKKVVRVPVDCCK